MWLLLTSKLFNELIFQHSPLQTSQKENKCTAQRSKEEEEEEKKKKKTKKTEEDEKREIDATMSTMSWFLFKAVCIMCAV